MDKKEAKKQYLKMRLEDPAVPEWEKKEIRQRLGVDTIVSENDFIIQATDELLHFVYNYLEAQLSAIRRKKQTSSPFGFLPDNLKAIYFLSTYSSFFEDDSLEQMYEYEESVDEMRKLSQAFSTINREREAALINSVLNKRKITGKEVELLQKHFWDSELVVQEIETAIKDFIMDNIRELIELQNI